MISTQLITLNYPVINTLALMQHQSFFRNLPLYVFEILITNITNKIINDGSIVRLKDNPFNNL